MEICKNYEEMSQRIEDSSLSKAVTSGNLITNPHTETEVKTPYQQTRSSARVFKKLKLEKEDINQNSNADDSPNLADHDTPSVEPKEQISKLTRSSARVTKKMKMELQEEKDTTITDSILSPGEASALSTPSEQVLLGSLTTTSTNIEGEVTNKGQQIRSSARVVKKLKLDLVSSPPVVEKKIEKKEEVKADIKRNFRPLWSSDDKNMFFEALNEFGKDFENIHSYMSNKLKKKGVPEHLIKTKDQIRHFYHRTWHEISKYVKFSDGVKKVVQELYGIINYGELRKKVGLVSEKSCLKLSELIYCGSTVLRVKGKTIRVRTPLCRALRKFNQLDDKYDEIKLPNRVTVELRPKDMSSFLRVQTMAQNPRLRTILPLQKRLSSLISCVNKRWKSIDALMYDKALISSNAITTSCLPSVKESEEKKELFVRPLRLRPTFDSKIELPSINLSEYLTRQTICLNSYEDRLGIKSPDEYRVPLKSVPKKGSGSHKTEKSVTHTQPTAVHLEEKVGRNEEVDLKTEEVEIKTEEVNLKSEEVDLNETKSDATLLNVVDDAVNTILSLQQEFNKDQAVEEVKGEETAAPSISVKEKETKVKFEKKDSEPVKVVLDQEKLDKIRKIRRGWTESESDSLTVGEVYLMCGSDSKLVMEYSWDDLDEINDSDKETTGNCVSGWSTTSDAAESSTHTQAATNSIPTKKHTDLSYSLSQLLSLAKLHYRKNMLQCPCGHTCNLQNTTHLKQQTADSKIRKVLTDNKCGLEYSVSAEHHNKTKLDENTFADSGSVFIQQSFTTDVVTDPGVVEFRSPYTVQQQLNSIKRLKPKYCNRKGRRPRSKQVVVERKLPLLPNKVESGHQIVRMNIISQQRTAETDEQKNLTVVTNPAEHVPVIFLTTQNVALPTATVTSVCQSLPSLTEDSNTLPTVPNSPSRLLKEGENQWINAEVADYSLSSLLGHLESPMKGSASNLSEGEYNRLSHDVDAQLQSLLTESSVDFAAKFADLAAEVVSEAKQ